MTPTEQEVDVFEDAEPKVSHKVNIPTAVEKRSPCCYLPRSATLDAEIFKILKN